MQPSKCAEGICAMLKACIILAAQKAIAHYLGLISALGGRAIIINKVLKYFVIKI